ncbi:MAG: Na/Pi cotransporter family protein [Burkholderiales bacterium]|uniref:Na/Pi cotransporter family protein n=1 Tax=Inhella sp. TaxID=1921806 RepID=UPI001AD57124|nr:Na/Pi cotransporter family protein [Burkholderiales bacterium]
MPDALQLAITVLAAVLLFLHGLEAFSDELTRLGGDSLRGWLARLTRSDGRAAFTGAFSTALLQSSSAVSSMSVTLADRRVIGARATLGVMVGANVGTTLTAWLVALKIAGLGPLFVCIGGLWSMLAPQRWRAQGKVLFYFGLIFLALDWIAAALAPLAQHPEVASLRLYLDHPLLALGFGVLLTALVQSSSVVSGLAVLSVAQGVIAPGVAVWMVAGANVGTTSTALLASAQLGALARKLAVCNTAFNVLGVLLFATLLQPVIAAVLALELAAGQRVALVHTLFNTGAAVVSLLLLPWIWSRLQPWLEAPTPPN